MNANLAKAEAIFTSLNWNNVTADNILQQPLGSKEQQKIALLGLKSGKWGDYVKVGNAFQWQDYVKCNKAYLALYAIRIGVSVSRALKLAHYTYSSLLLPVIIERGENYAQNFVQQASAPTDLAVQLVDRLNLIIPENQNYIGDWTLYAAVAMRGCDVVKHFTAVIHDADIVNPFYDKIPPNIAQCQRRFIEHIQIAIALNTPATGSFSEVFRLGVTLGWLDREQAKELIFLALDIAIRPIDRKVWLDTLYDLGVTDAELCQRVPVLIPLLAMGESAIINRLAPVLIPFVDDELLVEVMTACLSSKIKSVKKLVLKIALNRKKPKNADLFMPLLNLLLDQTDESIVALTSKLITKWHLDNHTIQSNSSELQQLWQPTPPLWQLPPFELEPISPDVLTELASELVKRNISGHDSVTERFLAVANIIAYHDPQAAKASLAGIKLRVDQLLGFLFYWRKGEEIPYHKYLSDLLTARDYIVCKNLGKIPCLLSTPSMSDLSITVDDLSQRLAIYQQLKIDALEADLFLALTRLDVSTKTSSTIEKLKKLNVAVVLQSGQKMPIDAGSLVLQYLDDPLIEPKLALNTYIEDVLSLPQSLNYFPKRIGNNGFTKILAIFPLWNDSAIPSDIDWATYYHQGFEFQQIVNRRSPFDSRSAMALLAMQRANSPYVASNMAQAVNDAWQRGLLIPGVADILLLERFSQVPCRIASLVSVLTDIAKQGILSVVWPILDQLIIASCKAPRLLSGTLETVDAIAEFLPEVQYAVDQGIADANQLQLLGIRMLASKEGSANAIKKAKAIVEKLPKIAPLKQDVLMRAPDDFDQVWSKPQKAKVVPEDNVSITISKPVIDQSSRFSKALAKSLMFTLKLPNVSNQVFHIVKNDWYYDLEYEFQCEAYPPLSKDQQVIPNFQSRVWLHWCINKQLLVVEKTRNWQENNDGPLSSKYNLIFLNTDNLIFSKSLVTVIIGLLAQDSDTYKANFIFEKNVKKGIIDADTMRKAIILFLDYPDLSPAKLIRLLEKKPSLLPIFCPVLIECIKFVGNLVKQGEKIPAWINRILDMSLTYAPYLKEATRRSYLTEPDSQWQGLADIAQAKAKSVAVNKAKQLLELLK
ncbi:MAG: hypothetical protein J6580_09120 [Gilliamella sp.]|uniref:hypothetical protein n=1 Tax=Gilliamella sp. TaxID=1891236 RepID=UPI0025F36B9D|nr:hypothetical protein [Gilliamella sp.]MCO6550828.1 hypothetical protein [Gilliamella sp.]